MLDSGFPVQRGYLLACREEMFLGQMNTTVTLNFIKCPLLVEKDGWISLLGLKRLTLVFLTGHFLGVFHQERSFRSNLINRHQATNFSADTGCHRQLHHPSGIRRHSASLQTWHHRNGPWQKICRCVLLDQYALYNRKERGGTLRVVFEVPGRRELGYRNSSPQLFQCMGPQGVGRDVRECLWGHPAMEEFVHQFLWVEGVPFD